jgi:acetylornithine deacetylase
MRLKKPQIALNALTVAGWHNRRMPQSVVELLADLVRINSINPDLNPGAPGEGVMAAYIANWLTEAGLEVHADEVRPNRPNVIARLRGTGGGKTLLLNGHTDVVGVAGMGAPFEPVIKDGRMYGRGSYDMKCGVAACMVAMRELAGARPRGDVLFTAVMDEEFAGLGSIDVAARYRADAAIVTEPTEMNLVIAHKGFVWAEIETHGIAAHGSRPQLGVDAIAKMGRVLTEIENWDRRMRLTPPHPLLGTPSAHASLIRGGQELSSYPERCIVEIERRTLPGETPAQVQVELQAIVNGCAALDPQFKASVSVGLSREPLETRAEHPISQLLLKHARRVLGATPAVTGVSFWTDAASLAERGIPAVLFGPRGAGAHALDEWVDLLSVQQCAEIYTAVAREFCG